MSFQKTKAVYASSERLYTTAGGKVRVLYHGVVLTIVMGI